MIELKQGTIITEYTAFVKIVDKLGFMPLSNNSLGYLCLDSFTTTDQWHTGLSSDPWPWRVDIECEHKAAYAKLFDKKPGFVSLEWYPVFIAARRKHRSFEEMYADGLLSVHAKRIYELFGQNDILATHEIKSLGGFTKETVSKYESAMTELQMNLFLTTNGMKRKISAAGEPYGWPATAYSKVELWAGSELFEDAMGMDPQHASRMILERIYEVLPEVELRKARKFAGVQA